LHGTQLDKSSAEITENGSRLKSVKKEIPPNGPFVLFCKNSKVIELLKDVPQPCTD
jgi:hypothetical protein